jgi:hypothetical protein
MSLFTYLMTCALALVCLVGTSGMILATLGRIRQSTAFWPRAAFAASGSILILSILGAPSLTIPFISSRALSGMIDAIVLPIILLACGECSIIADIRATAHQTRQSKKRMMQSIVGTWLRLAVSCTGMLSISYHYLTDYRSTPVIMLPPFPNDLPEQNFVADEVLLALTFFCCALASLCDIATLSGRARQGQKLNK